MKSKMSIFEMLGLFLIILVFIGTCIFISYASNDYIQNLPSDRFLPEVIKYE